MADEQPKQPPNETLFESIRPQPSRSRSTTWARRQDSRNSSAPSATSERLARSTSRGSSRPRSPHSHLHRIYSAYHINDLGLHIDDADHQSTDRLSQSSERVSSDSPSPISDDEEKEEHEEHTEYEIRGGVVNERDVEKGEKLERQQSSRSKKEKDPNLVTWDGPDDPDNPKNWTLGRKWVATVVVSSFTFISPVSSSMVAPALDAINRDLGVSNTVESQLMLSIFILAYAIGPLFLGPLSELYGRTRVLQVANLFYFVWNLACGFAQTGPQMIVFRFLSGLGGSAPLAIGGGVLADAWHAEQRGRAISAYSLAPLLGPAVGPIAGGFIAENTTWRWVFWATCIADICIQVSGFFLLQETYAPILLYRKMVRLRKETGNGKLYTEYHVADWTLAKKLRVSLVRPFKMLSTQPIIQVLAIYMAFLYGVMYLVLATFPGLWTNYYGESVGIGGLNYISLGVGFFMGAQITAPINDRIYRKLKHRNNGVGQPEFRCPTLFPGALLVPIGLFLYGWSAQYRVFWLVPNIGAAFLAAGTIIGFQSIQTYLVDSYTQYAASAVAAATVLRSLAGFGFPLFAPYMYAALDYGWGNSLLGFLAVALGLPAPFMLWRFGPKLRAKSQFAAGGL